MAIYFNCRVNQSASFFFSSMLSRLARFDVARFCNVKSLQYFGAGFYLSTRNAERGYPETSQFKINKTWSGRRAIRPARRKSTVQNHETIIAYTLTRSRLHTFETVCAYTLWVCNLRSPLNWNSTQRQITTFYVISYCQRHSIKKIKKKKVISENLGNKTQWTIMDRWKFF